MLEKGSGEFYHKNWGDCNRHLRRKKMQKHYIIGDIHGEYKILLKLIAKLPKDAKLIFVGDLIDRGLQSREIIFVEN